MIRVPSITIEDVEITPSTVITGAQYVINATVIAEEPVSLKRYALKYPYRYNSMLETED